MCGVFNLLQELQLNNNDTRPNNGSEIGLTTKQWQDQGNACVVIQPTLTTSASLQGRFQIPALPSRFLDQFNLRGYE